MARSVPLIRRMVIPFINLLFSDVMGIVKSVTIPASHLRAHHRRRAVDRRLVDRRLHPHRRVDMYLMPDLSTFAVIPWERGEFTTARVICWVFNPNGDPFPGDPRGVLLRQLERLASSATPTTPGRSWSSSSSARTATTSPLPHDRGGYFDLSTDLASTVRKDMVNALEEMGIEVEASHHEVAIGQHEIDFEYGDAIPTADRARDLQVRAQGDRPEARAARDLHAQAAGGDQRLRHALPPELRGWIDGGENAFVDTDDAYGLSTLAKHFIAGQLAHARGCAGDRAAGQLLPAAGARATRRRSTSPGRGPTARR